MKRNGDSQIEAIQWQTNFNIKLHPLDKNRVDIVIWRSNYQSAIPSFLNCKMSLLNWIRGKTRQNYTVNAKMTSWKIVKSSEVNQSCAFPEPLQLIIELFFSLVLNSNLNIVVTYLLWATRNLYKNISFSIKLLLTEGSKSKSCTIKTAKPNEATLISRQ